MPELLLAIDAGTTTARVCVFSAAGELLARSAAPVVTASPSPGRIEQDAEAIWRTLQGLIRDALAAAGRAPADVAAIGVTTQRTSLVAWDRRTVQALGPMVVWSDLRGSERAKELGAAGFPVAPQQAAAKLERLIAETPGAGALAAAGHLAAGNIDAFLTAKLSGGALHITDRSQGWPMGYLDLLSFGWNQTLLDMQGIKPDVLPELVDTWGNLGKTSAEAFGAVVPIAAIIADQQAALIGHGAEEAGSVKVTYGTSGTLDAGTGGGLVFLGMAMPPFIVSHVAGQTRFCLEGMVLSAGSAIDWLRTTFSLGDHAAFEALAASAPDAGGVAFLPSLQGIGAPNPDPTRRAALTGLSAATGPAQIARAALEGVAFRVCEILRSVVAGDGVTAPDVLKVDGGLAMSDVLLQAQADFTQLPVARHAMRDAAAVGAAIGAGLGAGILTRDDAKAFTRHDRVFEPAISGDEATARLAAWREQVNA